MRIGIDGRPLSTQSGIGRYTRQILEHWAISQAHELFLYGCPQAHWRGTYGRPLPNVPCVPGSVSAQIYYPRWARQDRLDVFWSPRHHLPVLPGTPTVVTIHDLVWRKSPGTMMRLNRMLDALLMPRAVQRANRVIVVSDSTKKDLIEWRPDVAPKIEVIHCAPIFRPGNTASEPVVEPPYILFVGTFEPRKNLGRLLEAYAALRRSDPRTPTLVLAGSAGWRFDLPTAIAALGLTRHVEVIRSPTDQALAALYEHCLFLVMPSLYEGFGLPIVEAMAFAKPVIAGNTSSMPEVTGGGGLLVNPLSPEDIAEAMRRLLQDTTLRQTLGVRAQIQGESLSWERSAAETLAVIEAAAATRKPS